jgi:hypothetical protein
MEKIWEKGFEAAWTPVGEALKNRFTHLAGKDQESQRRAAFEKAAKAARTLTLQKARDRHQAERILDLLDGKLDKSIAEEFNEEAAKLMLFSAAPDVPRVKALCQRRLQFESLLGNEPPPSSETLASVLSDYLTNLHTTLLDQVPYRELVEQEMLRALWKIATELHSKDYDTEDIYRDRLGHMYRELEFVGIPEQKEHRPITIEDIFIRLQASREKIPEIEEKGLAEKEEQNDKHELKEQAITNVTASDILREAKHLVVKGDPGSGKTMLLKYLVVTCADKRAEVELGLKANEEPCPLPVFIPLREFAAESAQREGDYSLLDFFYTHAHEHLMVDLPRGFFEAALDSGCCLVCLDGLDEIWTVGQRKTVCDAVKALAGRFPKSRYVVTSRIVGYEESPLDRRDFVHYSILPLTDAQIRDFLQRWYGLREHDPTVLKQRVNSLITTIQRKPRIRELARNPLLLTIIALVHRVEAELPNERVKLYDICVTALVKTWEDVKGLTIVEKQRPFYEYRRRLLEQLAYELHTRAEKPGQIQSIKEGDLEILLMRFLMQNPRLGMADDPDGARDEARALIKLAVGRTGLLVERGKGEFAFPHLTFQEYLAACDIENRCMHHGVAAIWEEIKERLHTPHWREVILLLFGSLNQYDEAPTLLIGNVMKAGEADRLESAVHRHLFLAAAALTDKASLSHSLHEAIVDQLLGILSHRFSYEDNGIGEVSITGEAGDAYGFLKRLVGDTYLGQRLSALLDDPQIDVTVRNAYLGIWGEIGQTREAVEQLLTIASDRNIAVVWRRDAIATVDRLGITDEDVLNGLLTLVQDSQEEIAVRREAAFTLGTLGIAKQKVLDGLEALNSSSELNSEIRWATAIALQNLGSTEKAAEVFRSLMLDPQLEAASRIVAIASLGQQNIDNAAIEILVALLSDLNVSSNARELAAEWLRYLGHADKVVEILLDQVANSQIQLSNRCRAALALPKYDAADERVPKKLTELALNLQENDRVRSAAGRALARLNRADTQILDSLLGLVGDPQADGGARIVAAQVLIDSGYTQKEVGKVVLGLARDSQVRAGARSAATWALEALVQVEDEAVDCLLSLVSDGNLEPEVRASAVEALGQLDRPSEKVLDHLFDLAQNLPASEKLRCTAYESLKQLIGVITD